MSEKILQNHTVTSYDKDLKGIISKMGEMNKNIAEILGIFIESIDTQTEEQRIRAKEIDKKINHLEIEVEQECINVMARRAPMAFDLRFLISSIKVSTILERLGDISKKLVKRTIKKVGTDFPEAYKADFKEMAQNVILMLDNAVAGFNTQDVQQSDKVWRSEDKVDDKASELFTRISEDMKKNPEKVDVLVQILLNTRRLERMADYCTKIAKIAHYTDSGNRVSEKDF
jgi:phosphate transport system protein